MKHLQKKALLIALISGFNLVAADATILTNRATPYYSIRSQGTNAAREMVGWEQYINLCNTDCYYGAVALAGEYSQSFDGEKICKSLFGYQTTRSNVLSTRPFAKLNGAANTSCSDCSGCDDCCIVISGSTVETGKNDSADWVADYFGLPTDYQSTVCFAPRIKNFVADVEGYLGFNRDCIDGLYARVHLPITWTQWNLNYTETRIDEGTSGYNEGYFGPNSVARENLVAKATDFFNGKSAPTIGDNITFEKLACSKWAPCSSSCTDKVRLADVEAVLGWNFACDEDSHFGFNARFTAPTGNKPDGKFLFEPIVGNGGHWEFGGGLTCHTNLWRCDHSDASFNMYLDANITHLFNACQTRSFDLLNNPNSRYWLALKLGKNNDGLVGDATVSDFQFADAYAPIANLTCIKVEVSNKVQADVALKFEYTCDNGVTTDIGYNFWIRTCDKIKRCQLTRLETENWALKGSAYVYGFATDDSAIALAPSALLTSDTVLTPVINPNDATNGLSISDPQLASLEDTTRINDADGEQVYTSIQPALLGAADVEFIGTKGMSNKIFANFNYSWVDCEDYTPFIGIGAAGEFGQGRDCDDRCDLDSACDADCDDNNVRTHCARAALSQWSVWIKGGLAFN